MSIEEGPTEGMYVKTKEVVGGRLRGSEEGERGTGREENVGSSLRQRKSLSKNL